MELVKRVDEISPKSLITVPEVQSTFNEASVITTEKVFEQYKDLFEGLGCLPGEHKIKLKTDAVPVIHPPRKVPVALQKQVKIELERMENLKVIQPVTEATEWVSSMVTVVKPGKVRICLDPKNLNAAIMRKHYPMLTIEEVVAKLANAKWFSVLDASSGFWQIKLDEESRKLTTFNTPFGRYQFNRLPFGISSAPELFQSTMKEVISNLPGVETIMDDVLVWGETEAEHDRNLLGFLERAREVNLKLRKDKCQFKVKEVPYIGHLLTQQGLRPSPERVRAVVEMKEPTNVPELRRFTGTIQYLAKFIPSLSQVMQPLRELLKKTTRWEWCNRHQKAFEELKKKFTEYPVLKYYDVSKPVRLSVDASQNGLGAVCRQEEIPVAYASRALTETEKRYAQIEKELLAVVYGYQKFHHYIYGKKVIVETDHKPLENINVKPLRDAPPRLQKMLLKLQKYDIQLQYKPGKLLYLVDALSRAHSKDTGSPESEEEFEVSVVLSMSSERLLELKTAPESDPALTDLKKVVLEGWPDNKSQVKKGIAAYWDFREQISVHDGVLFKGERVIVPENLRSDMLKRVHQAHQGSEACKRRARELLYWPGMSQDIEEVVRSCSVCNLYSKSQCKEPLKPHEVPEGPWRKVGADLFSFGGPNEVITDNGPQFRSKDFDAFVRSWSFTHTTSSPYFPQSNGIVERAVQDVKRILGKAKEDGSDPYLAMLNARNTPRDNIVGSPAQRLHSRRLDGVADI